MTSRHVAPEPCARCGRRHYPQHPCTGPVPCPPDVREAAREAAAKARRLYRGRL